MTVGPASGSGIGGRSGNSGVVSSVILVGVSFGSGEVVVVVVGAAGIAGVVVGAAAAAGVAGVVVVVLGVGSSAALLSELVVTAGVEIAGAGVVSVPAAAVGSGVSADMVKREGMKDGERGEDYEVRVTVAAEE